MKKIKSVVVMLLVAMMLIMPLQASACTAVQSVQLRNARFCPRDQVIECGLEIVRVANARIEDIIEESIALANQTSNPDEVKVIIAAMLVRTSAVSLAAQTAAAVCGVETVCEYVDITIGGHTVPVDPLRVVRV